MEDWQWAFFVFSCIAGAAATLLSPRRGRSRKQWLVIDPRKLEGQSGWERWEMPDPATTTPDEATKFLREHKTMELLADYLFYVYSTPGATPGLEEHVEKLYRHHALEVYYRYRDL